LRAAPIRREKADCEADGKSEQQRPNRIFSMQFSITTRSRIKPLSVPRKNQILRAFEILLPA
jgi:hypothetical protein